MRLSMPPRMDARDQESFFRLSRPILFHTTYDATAPYERRVEVDEWPLFTTITDEYVATAEKVGGVEAEQDARGRAFLRFVTDSGQGRYRIVGYHHARDEFLLERAF